MSPLDWNIDSNAYVHEAKRFALRVENVSGSALQGAEISISGSGVSFPVAYADMDSRRYTFLRMRAGEVQEKVFEVKPTGAGTVEFAVSYGVGDLNNSFREKFSASPSPVAMAARFGSGLAEFGGKGSIIVKAENVSQAALSGVKVSLVSSAPGFVGSEFEAPSLGPGESSERELRFEGSLPGKPVAVRAVFDDLLGRHILEFNIEQGGDARGLVAGALVAIIVLLVAIAFVGAKIENLKKGVAKSTNLKGKGEGNRGTHPK